MLHEDFADFALQIKKSGGEIVISNGSRVYHHERRSLLPFLRQRFKNSGNLIRLKRKWPEQQFHFYASHRSSFLNIFATRIRTFIEKGKIKNCLKYVGIIVLSVAVYEFGNLYFRVLYHEKLNRKYIRIKPIIDFFLAIVFFVVSIPAMVLIGLIIKIDSPGSIIFSQIRIGKGLKLFRFYKFRTMRHDAKLRFPDLYDYKLMPDEVDNFKFKTADDPRLTRFGRYLRKTSLDELPNLINVIRGDMNLIGPRPEIPEMLPNYKKEDMVKFTVKPGITGHAQVMGRGLLTFKQTIKYDIEYIFCQGLLVDIKIITWTIYVVLRGLGAF
jgi:lipopolysaccharide/colanic/teichoic acid biosynthesis glycosyltransferase